MTKTTIYTCDKCGATSEKADDIIGIAIVVQQSSYQMAYGAPKSFYKHWCIPCLKKFDLIPQPSKDKPKPVPTFNDLIEELMEEIVGRQMDERS